jgi:hypothetical protein
MLCVRAARGGDEQKALVPGYVEETASLIERETEKDV